MYYVGVDVGGTNIKAGLVDESGMVCESRQIPTSEDSIDALVSSIATLVEQFRAANAIDAVGVGVAGLLSHSTGIMETSPNIACLEGVNLGALVSERLGMLIVVENDAKAGAYGEWICGAGRGRQHMAYVTLGTGLGCGLILSGRLFLGASGFAGELGHTVIEPGGRRCACGSRGCVETRVSATALVATALEHLDQRPGGLLAPFRDSLTARIVHDAATAGDPAAVAAFQDTGRFLGMACANLIGLFNLETIVIGGGVMAGADLLLGPALEEVQRTALAPAARDCRIVKSELWPDAGVIGAALLARDG